MAVVVCRIEPRKGDAGKFFRKFGELEYFRKFEYNSQYRIVVRIDIVNQINWSCPIKIKDGSDNLKDIAMR